MEAAVSAWKECPTCDAQFALQASLNDHLATCPGAKDKQRIAELEAALKLYALETGCGLDGREPNAAWRVLNKK